MLNDQSIAPGEGILHHPEGIDLMPADIQLSGMEERIERTKSKAVTADMFVSAVRKYTRARKLTPRMLNELVQRIEVHQAEKVDGVWVQRLTIHYNCVGAITIPENLPLPIPDITVNTRKGVYVSYQPDSKAG